MFFLQESISHCDWDLQCWALGYQPGVWAGLLGTAVWVGHHRNCQAKGAGGAGILHQVRLPAAGVGAWFLVSTEVPCVPSVTLGPGRKEERRAGIV